MWCGASHFPLRGRCRNALHRDTVPLGARGEIRRVSDSQPGHCLEVCASDIVGLERDSELSQPAERTGQVIDCVIRHRERAVAARVTYFEPVVDDVLLADLHVVGNVFSVRRLSPPALVETEMRVY